MGVFLREDDARTEPCEDQVARRREVFRADREGEGMDEKFDDEDEEESEDALLERWERQLTDEERFRIGMPIERIYYSLTYKDKEGSTCSTTFERYDGLTSWLAEFKAEVAEVLSAGRGVDGTGRSQRFTPEQVATLNAIISDTRIPTPSLIGREPPETGDIVPAEGVRVYHRDIPESVEASIRRDRTYLWVGDWRRSRPSLPGCPLGVFFIMCADSLEDAEAKARKIHRMGRNGLLEADFYEIVPIKVHHEDKVRIGFPLPGATIGAQYTLQEIMEYLLEGTYYYVE